MPSQNKSVTILVNEAKMKILRTRYKYGLREKIKLCRDRLEREFGIVVTTGTVIDYLLIGYFSEVLKYSESTVKEIQDTIDQMKEHTAGKCIWGGE